ncbi:MAG: HNH endonuclease [Candidatus Parabeggiatoa sp. nov. 1]|nr:MAG: HNH endonuclease [Gammaproteobacteria bacterium]
MSKTYISTELRRQVRTDAGKRCGYCLSAEIITGIPLEIEHIIPESLGGLTVRENLWLACHRCNKFKGERTQFTDPVTTEMAPLFNPRAQNWYEHFHWNLEGIFIIGETPSGRATIEALQLNNEYVVEARRFWVIAGWHPPANEPW